MYIQILKKDLKRKKTMNLILFLFIILAATFIAGSVNNMVSVMTALDTFFEKAKVPDHLITFGDLEQAEAFAQFADKEGYTFLRQEVIQIDPKEIEKADGDSSGRRTGDAPQGYVQIDYNNTIVLSRFQNTVNIFGENDQEVTHVSDGEIYFAAKVGNEEGIAKDSRVRISDGASTKQFTVAGSVKDAIFASEMAGMTRIFVSDSDYAAFDTPDAKHLYLFCVYTDDTDFSGKFNRLGLSVLMVVSQDEIRLLYMVDMVIAAVMLVVSVCLILISMVILRFTIHFTMSEEFREIGVMKAIGIPNRKIRGLYIVKYFAVALAGGAAGLLFSIPFGRLMLDSLSQTIMMESDGNFLWNVVCTVAVVAVVVLFGYSCTRKIKGISPMDAIRNGENGERYARKSVLALHRSRLPAVLFLALNDILSGIRRYAALILIFTIGILLIVIPVNAMNTLQSGHLITWFSMAQCDHVISKEMLFHTDSDNREFVEEELEEVREKISGNGISARVYEEVLFRMGITFEGKQESSLAFQGVGDITADKYQYLKGSAPQDYGEVGISHLIADRLGAEVGDTVSIQNGDTKGRYLVTAIFQTMNNMGEGIRFYEKEALDYSYVFGSFGIQISYTDMPDGSELKKRKEQLMEWFPNYKVYTAGEYVSEMIGDISGQLKGMKYLILAVVLCINMLVTVLMVKSFLTKERGEIAMLKAIGFENASLAIWQAMRIGIVLLFAAVAAAVLAVPLSQVSIGPIFQMMGAQRITFDIRPFEIYVFYPMLVFAVAVLSAMLTARQVNRIPASDASNIE
ncbi:MAG: FtsX-like permease family protein [Eubacterium sp.]|nr:FtsX-like permease family protein [Eubacterium sp.]